MPARLDGDRIRLADAVLVYLERTPALPDPVPSGSVPRPYGVAPLAMTPDGDVVAAIWPGEAVWLGFQAVDRTVATNLRIRIDGPPAIDALTGRQWSTDIDEGTSQLTCPPTSSFVGRPVVGGRRLLGNDALDRFTLIALTADPVAVTVQLVRPAEFTQLSGRIPAPPDPRDGFSGRQLP